MTPLRSARRSRQILRQHVLHRGEHLGEVRARVGRGLHPCRVERAVFGLHREDAGLDAQVVVSSLGQVKPGLARVVESLRIITRTAAERINPARTSVCDSFSTDGVALTAGIRTSA